MFRAFSMTKTYYIGEKSLLESYAVCGKSISLNPFPPLAYLSQLRQGGGTLVKVMAKEHRLGLQNTYLTPCLTTTSMECQDNNHGLHMKDLKGTDDLIRLLSVTHGHKQGDWENFKLLSPKATINIKCILTPT